MIANLAKKKDDFRMAVFCEPSVGVVNDKGETGLHITARLNLPALTEDLLAQGANVNVQAQWGIRDEKEQKRIIEALRRHEERNRDGHQADI